MTKSAFDAEPGSSPAPSVERFVSPSPPMEGYDRELLTVLIEECAEVQQRASKAIRFGIGERQPGQHLSNAERLAAEIGDLLEVVSMAVERGLVDQADILNGRLNKKRQMAKYMQASPLTGPASDRTKAQRADG